MSNQQLPEQGLAFSDSFTNDISDAEFNTAIDQLAEVVSGRGMVALTVFFLEAHRPLRAIIGQATLFSAPLLTCFFGSSKVQTVLRIMENDNGYERLIMRLEELR